MPVFLSNRNVINRNAVMHRFILDCEGSQFE